MASNLNSWEYTRICDYCSFIVTVVQWRILHWTPAFKLKEVRQCHWRPLIKAICINGGSWRHWWIYNNRKQNYALVESNYHSFISSAYWEVVITWFYSTGCREFASSKIILHLQLLKMDGFESPLPYFPLPTLQSTELHNSELETSSSTQKNVSSLSLTWSWSCLYFFDC